ncbi:Fis family transcriptional regulator [Shewanella sp. OMA3-2]|uniref:Fis family transcriptional regulator n=1 Tax=Shewanella sp. OMA3-2 TaxID=2908650 RepID=UPI001F47E565|nr:Fis family transcriptional regulator [Shewanella sp. OMA3-2]UJF21544.1 Fis family transcriptional regulator [Shewanella sp. OMA3-2]
MRKTDKKIDNQIRQVLTQVCEIALNEYSGFQWLTHIVNYSDFPKSLQVICVFDTPYSLNRFMASVERDTLSKLIQAKLLSIKVTIDSRQVCYDSEDNRNQKTH